MPSGGVLADAIGLELLQFGFDIIDTAQVSSILIRDNLSEIELAQPQNLLRLHHDGIEAVIIAKSVAGYDSKPQSINVKIIQTLTGRVMTGANWQNGRGGGIGSAADQSARVGLVEAAQQIAIVVGQSIQALQIE